MSNTIDERVVQFELDNGSFEKDAERTIKTLDELEKALELKNGTKGLEEVEAAAEKTDFDSLIKAADTVTDRLSVMGMIGMNALTNITNKAIDTGEKLVKSLTVDQVTAGYSKYEQKTAAIQTIMNATGLGIEDVNDQLEKLNWFTDETSYNFIDMVSNIGKFTSQQIGLEESVTAMQGIATWAAKAGQGTNEASRAMYNMAQAMGVGAVKLQDWKSIQNANMATAEFKEMAIQVAETMGTVEKGTVTVQNFDQTLQKGWFTKDVLMNVLGTYGSYADEVYKYIQQVELAEGRTLTCAEAMQEMGDMGMELGASAFKAAQEAKTFTEAIEATKDAVSTGWMTTFETIFGTYDKAKVMWTDLANGLYDIFAAGGDNRNLILADAFNDRWDTLSKKLKAAGVSSEQFESALSQTLKSTGKDTDFFISNFGSLENAFKSGELNGKYLVTTIENLANAETSVSKKTIDWTAKLEEYNRVAKEMEAGKYGWGDERKKALEDAGYNYELIHKLALQTHGSVGASLEELQQIMKEVGYTEQDFTEISIENSEALKMLAAEASESGSSFNNILMNMYKAGGREVLHETMNNILNSIINFKDTVSETWSEVFSGDVAMAIYNIVDKLNAFSKSLLESSENTDKLRKVLTLLFSTVKVGVKGIEVGISAIGAVLRLVSGLLGEFAPQFDFLGKLLGNVADNTQSGLDRVISALDDLSNKLKAITYEDVKKKVLDFVASLYSEEGFIRRLQNRISKFTNVLKSWGSSVSKYFSPIINLFNKLKNFLAPVLSEAKYNFILFKEYFLTNVIEPVTNFINRLKESEDPIGTLLDGFGSIGSYINTIRTSFGTFIKTLDFSSLKDVGKKILDPLSKSFDKFKEAMSGISDKLDWVNVIKVIAGGLLLYNITLITDALGKIGNLAYTAQTAFTNLNKILKAKLLYNFANNFKIVANSIFIVAIALAGLTMLPMDKLKVVVNELLLLMIVMAAISRINTRFAKKMSPEVAANIAAIGLAMISFAGALLILSGSAFVLSKIKFESFSDFAAFVGELLAMSGILVGSVLVLGKYGEKFKTSVGSIIGIALAIALLSIALASLAKMSKNLDVDSVLYIGLIMLGLVGVINIASRIKPTHFAVAMLAAVASIILIIEAIERLKTFDLSGLNGKFKEIGVIIGVLAGIIVALSFVSKRFEGTFKDILFFGAGLAMLIGSVYLLIRFLNSIEEVQVTDGAISALERVGVIVALLTMVLGLAARLAGGSKGFVSIAFGVLASVVSIFALFTILETFKDLKLEDIRDTLVTMGWIVGGISVLILAMGGAAKLGGTKGIIYLLTAVMSLVLIGTALFSLAGVPWNDLWPVVTAISVVMIVMGGMFLMIGVAAKMAGKASGSFRVLITAVGLIAILGATLYFAGKNDWTSLAAIGGTIVAVLLSLTLMFKVMSNMTIKTSTLLTFIGMVGSLGVMAVLLGIAASKFGEIESDKMWKTLAVMLVAVGVLSVIVVGMSALMGAVPVIAAGATIFSIAILAISASALIFAASCAILNGCDLMTIAEGLAAIGGTAGAMFEFGLALIAAGAGCIVCAIGFAAIGLAGKILAPGVLSANDAITELVLTLSTLLSALGGDIGAKFSKLRDDLLENSAVIATVARGIGSGAATSQAEGISEGTSEAVAAVETGQNEINSTLEAEGEVTAENARKIGRQMAKAQAEGYSEGLAGEEFGMDAILAAAADSGFNGDGGWLSNLNVDGAKEKIGSLIQSIFGDIDFSSITSVFGDGLSGVFSGSIDAIDTSGLSSMVNTETQSAFENVDVSRQAKATVNQYVDTLVGQLSSSTAKSRVKSAGTTLGSQAKEGADSVSLKSSGANFVSGFVTGVQNNAWRVKEAINAVATQAATELNVVLQIHSPSRVARQSGMWFDEGFSVGINDNAFRVIKSVTKFAEAATDAFDETLQNGTKDSGNIIRPVFDMSSVYDQLSGYEAEEWNPVIKPVLDMSGIKTEVDNIDGIISARSIRTDANESKITDNNTHSGEMVFNQFNYSPKPLDRIEIYRQTKNLVSSVKGR